MPTRNTWIYLALYSFCSFVLNPSVQTSFAGSLVSQGGVIPIAAEGLEPLNWPAIGFFSPVGRHFLVFWVHEISNHDGYNYWSNIHGRFVEPDGKLLPEKAYSFSLTLRPYVDFLTAGYNSILDNYLIVWTDSYRIYSRVVNSTGTLGRRTLVLRGDDPALVSMAFSTFTNQFLYALDPRNEQQGITLQLLDATGRKIGNSSTTTKYGLFATLVADPDAPGYFLIWQEARRNIMFQKINASGSPVETPRKLLAENRDSSLFAPAYNPTTKQFLFLSAGPLTTHYKFRPKSFLVDRDGHLIRLPKFIGNYVDDAAVTPVGKTGYVITYGRSGHLWVRLLNSNGFPIGNEVRVTSTPGEYLTQNVIYAESLKRCLVLWVSSGLGYEKIYGRFVRIVP